MSRSFNISRNSAERLTRAQSRRVAVAGGLLIATAVAVMALAGGDLSNRVTAASRGAADVSVTGRAAPSSVNQETLSARVTAGSAARAAITDLRVRALLEDPAIRDYIGPSENAWDFTVPGGVPGFGPLAPSAEPRPRVARAPAVE